jgi:hypothetical protein
MAASAAGSTAWTTAGLVFLAVVSITPIPAVPGFHSDYSFINEHSRKSMARFEISGVGGRMGAIACFDIRQAPHYFHSMKKRKQSRRDCFRKTECSDSQLDGFEDEPEEDLDEESLFEVFVLFESLEALFFSVSFFAACL